MSLSAVALADMPTIIVAPNPAGIVQGQEFAVGSVLVASPVMVWSPGMTNVVVLSGGDQTANGKNILIIGPNKQDVGNCDACCAPYAHNMQFGSFTQQGEAYGECAHVNIEQGLASYGDQWQVVGNGCGLKAQGNELGLATLQGISRSEGPGGGKADQTVVLDTSQAGGNVVGPMSQNSTIFAVQDAAVDGKPCSEGSATSTLAVTTSQFQIVN